MGENEEVGNSINFYWTLTSLFFTCSTERTFSCPSYGGGRCSPSSPSPASHHVKLFTEHYSVL